MWPVESISQLVTAEATGEDVCPGEVRLALSRSPQNLSRRLADNRADSAIRWKLHRLTVHADS